MDGEDWETDLGFLARHLVTVSRCMNDYVRARLVRVGATRDPFSADALSMLHEAAGCSLRDTDRIATAALRTEARRKKKIVQRDHLSRILRDP